ncbi:MAG: L,D-transpeptidase [Pseudomonadota bacterium]
MYLRILPAVALSGLGVLIGLSSASNAETVTTDKPITVAAAATSPAAATAAKTKAKKPAVKKKVGSRPTLKISVDLTRQRMTVRQRGKVTNTFKISSGRKGYRTPTGHYRPKWMTKMHYSRKYDNAPMPYSIFYHGGYAIHATYATGRLGAPASHGCIRLSPANAKRLYNLVLKHKRANTRIVVTGVAKDRPAAVARKPKTKRKSYSQARYKKQYRQTSRQKPRVTYSYAKPSSSYGRTWPGDPPRRRLRY